MKCPGCGAEVEAGADLCLECGEPMGDSPAAKVSRQENVIRPPSDAFTPPKPSAAPKPSSAPPPKPTPPPPTLRGAMPTPPPGTRPAGAPPPPATKPATPAARKKWATEEPEPKRCPGCGTKTLAARCPGCGTKLHSDDD
jgi:hypothetical protein